MYHSENGKCFAQLGVRETVYSFTNLLFPIGLIDNT